MFDHPFNADSLARSWGVHDVYFLAVDGRCGQFLWSASAVLIAES